MYLVCLLDCTPLPRHFSLLESPLSFSRIFSQLLTSWWASSAAPPSPLPSHTSVACSLPKPRRCFLGTCRPRMWANPFFLFETQLDACLLVPVGFLRSLFHLVRVKLFMEPRGVLQSKVLKKHYGTCAYIATYKIRMCTVLSLFDCISTLIVSQILIDFLACRYLWWFSVWILILSCVLLKTGYIYKRSQ